MRLILVALAVACAPAAFAQQHDHAAPACATMDASLPAGLEDWNGGAPLKTVGKAAELGDTFVTVGKGYAAALGRTTSIYMPVAPEKPGGSVSYSGLFAFAVPQAGNYAVALSTAAWIDVLEDGKALEPLSFGHGPECTTIRKMVVYPLQAGQHVLQISGSGAETATLLVARQP